MDAEPYLKSAIDINGSLPNAFKNLGLAFLGRNEYARACEYFVSATQAEASDARSLKHLEELIARRPQLLTEIPGLGAKLADYRRAVLEAARLGPLLSTQLYKSHKPKRWWEFWR